MLWFDVNAVVSVTLMKDELFLDWVYGTLGE